MGENFKSPQFGYIDTFCIFKSMQIKTDKFLQSLKRYGFPIVCIQTNPLIRVKADKVVLDASRRSF